MSNALQDTTTPLTHLHGHFYFADLKSPDPEAVAPFYRQLFGWELDGVPGAPTPYLIARVDERRKAALATLDPEQAQAGTPPHWFTYLTVGDLDATVAKVDGLGGAVLVAPFDVMDIGRMSVVRDSTGAHLGLWEDRVEATTVKDEHGSTVWFELHSTDIDESLRFYGGLVGWTPESNDMGGGVEYHVMAPGGQAEQDPVQVGAAGMMQQMPQAAEAGVPSAWGVYFNVDDVDATVAKLTELGGSVVMGPMDIPGIGRSAAVRDPQGAMFQLLTPAPRA
ncbi:MAG: 27 kDa antigen [Thermoleophilia bacterium]|nr:27 kDa antigen [Thermoleophilia bacterium]